MSAPSILVLGGGRQGRIVASDLAPSFRVTVADARPVRIAGVRTVRADLSRGLDRLMARFDVVACALPSSFGLSVARAAVSARRPLVDLTFFAQDPFALDREARRAGVPIIPDCGLSPGLSNFIIGHLGGRPREVEIRVGGIAADRKRDYVVTWSVEDLIEEYVRPARIVRGGRQVTVPALSGLERVRVPGAGELEAFYTDGLRTLLHTCGARDMAEKTLRWPGHVARMLALRDLGLFGDGRRELGAAVLRAAYETPTPRDLVVLDVRVDKRRATMTARPRDGVTAMARTTALTCAVTTRAVAAGLVRESGVLPPERVGAIPAAYDYVRRELAKRGVKWAIT